MEYGENYQYSHNGQTSQSNMAYKGKILSVNSQVETEIQKMNKN